MVITRKEHFLSFEKISENNLVCVDENTVIPNITVSDFKKLFKDMEIKHSMLKKDTWMLQQLLVLHSCMLPQLPDKYIIIDMDLILLQKFPFFDGDDPIFNSSVFAERFDANHRYEPFVRDVLKMGYVDGKYNFRIFAR